MPNTPVLTEACTQLTQTGSQLSDSSRWQMPISV